MKIVKINGGLGNQLFQYAFAFALKEKGFNVFLDTSQYKAKIVRGGIDYYHNGFELQKVFNIDFPEASLKDIKSLSTPADNLFHRLLRKYFTKKTHFIDKKFNFQATLLENDSDIFLEGCWQTEKYFDFCSDKLRQSLVFKKTLSNKNVETLSKAGANPVSLHVRRGDFLNSENMNICTSIYYKNALQRLLNELNKRNEFPTSILVFSDDISWCKENLALPQSFEELFFVDWNKGDDSWQDMALMAQCKHNIICNSSFSWWGAWLNSNPNKIVIAPKLWNMRELNDNDKYYKYDFSDIVPSTWIRVETK